MEMSVCIGHESGVHLLFMKLMALSLSGLFDRQHQKMKTTVSLKRQLSWLLFVAVTSLLGFSATASEDDHERAMQAMQAGEIKPLAEILAAFSDGLATRVVEVELEQKRGRWIYEFKLLEQSGLVREIKVDARTAEILQSKYDD